MAIDAVDSIGDSFDIYDDRDEECPCTTWNGRQVCVLDPKENTIIDTSSKLFQFPEQTPPFLHIVEQLDPSEDDLPDFIFAPRPPLGDPFFSDNHPLSPAELELCKSFFQRLCHELKKGAKKAAEAFKKIMKAIAHAVHKAEKKVVDFVKDHKKEILIAVAVVAAACAVYGVTGIAIAGAAAAGGASPKKREGENDDSTASSSPPSDPPAPLPTWVQDLVASTAPNLSWATASDSELDSAKAEAHRALETLNHLKQLTEADLAHLKKEDPRFNPTAKAIETVVNTVFSDAQRHEFSVAPSPQQYWQTLISTGHERIDQGFSAITDYRAAIALPQPPVWSIADQIKLGFGIISSSLANPNSFDPNATVSEFLKGQNIQPPLEHSHQSVSEFINKTTLTLQAISGASTINPFFTQFITEIQQKFSLEQLSEFKHVKEPEKSMRVKIEGSSQPGMQISLTNGMFCSFADAIARGQYYQKLCPGNPSIELVYNHSNGFLDVLEALFINASGNSPETQELYMQQWTEFHEQNKDRPYAKLFQECHSQAAFHVLNALNRLPEEIRQRVIVVSIGGAVVIPKHMCYDSFNYASERDIVPTLGLWCQYWDACRRGETEREEFLVNLFNTQSELIRLKPHEEATGIDHSPESPTCIPVLTEHFEDYCQHGGEYR